DIFIELERRGLSAENAIYGMGGGLLQHHHRDTMNFGQKASAVCVNGQWRGLYKTPPRAEVKGSEAGRPPPPHPNGPSGTARRDSIPREDNVLVPVFRNGKLLRKWDFTELIERSERQYPESYYIDVVRPLREARASNHTAQKRAT